MSGPEHRHDEDRTGNGIVNHGPEDTPNTPEIPGTPENPDTPGTRDVPERDSADGAAQGAEAAPGAASGDGGGMDELALRRMLQGAVQGLEPSDGTLERLHRAVPARRARRRQGVVGAAARRC